MSRRGWGDNSGAATIEVEARLFNSLVRFDGDTLAPRRLSLPVGATVGDVMERLGVPADQVFLVLVNGRDITPGQVGDAVREGYVLEAGDVVALSGPVPFSWGYGAPVV